MAVRPSVLLSVRPAGWSFSDQWTVKWKKLGKQSKRFHWSDSWVLSGVAGEWGVGKEEGGGDMLPFMDISRLAMNRIDRLHSIASVRSEKLLICCLLESWLELTSNPLFLRLTQRDHRAIGQQPRRTLQVEQEQTAKSVWRMCHQLLLLRKNNKLITACGFWTCNLKFIYNLIKFYYTN